MNVHPRIAAAVEPDGPALLVAEIGINHDGDMDRAKASIDAAVRAGADSVKFQNYRTEDFVADRALSYEYRVNGRTVVESQYEMFKRCELDDDEVAELKRYCDAAGVLFHSTPTNARDVRMLATLGVPVLKNGSDYLTHLPLIAAMAQTGLPAVLSTGMATLEEIDDAVAAFRAHGNNLLILLHCTSQYPAPARDLHLRKIRALADRYEAPAGFSDHSEGHIAAVGARVLGACWIEKHFTIDKTLPGPDHRFSADEREFADLVRAVREIEAALAAAPLGATRSEEANREAFRLSCQTRTPLPAGHVLQEEDVVFRRPGTGMPPKSLAMLLGKRLTRHVEADHVLRAEDVQA